MPGGLSLKEKLTRRLRISAAAMKQDSKYGKCRGSLYGALDRIGSGDAKELN
jgi:hypothetical protein